MLLIDNVDDDDDHGVYGDVAGYGARNHAVAAAADEDSAGGGFGGDNINEDGNNDEYHKRLMLR